MAQFPLIDQASLAMIPGAYKESKVYSQLPTDGSGDFTFNRGTDNATRVNEEGLIEKSYENLLLQSNNFGSSPWSNNEAGDCLVTSGFAGYDGTNNAWEAKNDGRSYFNQIVTYPSQVKTFSIYAKSGNQDSFSIVIVKDGGDPNVTCDLGLGTITNNDIDNIDATITPVTGATGWYRISVTWRALSTGSDQIRINTGGTLGDTIFVQDAQINQGLVAYPYLETTTAPAYGGITDNQPRLNYTGDCPSLLLEESRTNLIYYSEYFNTSPWINRDVTTIENATTSPEGVQNATRINFSGTDLKRIEQNTPNDAGSCTASIYMKYIDHPYVMARLDSTSGCEYTMYNIQTGNIESSTMDDAKIIPVGDGWYRLIASQDILAAQEIFWYFTETSSINQNPWTGSGSLYAYGAQFEEGSTPSSYIPTYGSIQTRAAETLTATKTLPSEGTLYINVGGTTQPKLSVLGEFFDASTTENKVAIAYSATALKISHNGSIVVDKTGTYDVSSLTEIDLGHDGGTDQADTSIGEFITFGSFLTTTELNALTQ